MYVDRYEINKYIEHVFGEGEKRRNSDIRRIINGIIVNLEALTDLIIDGIQQNYDSYETWKQIAVNIVKNYGEQNRTKGLIE